MEKKKLIQNTCIMPIRYADNIDKLGDGGKGWIKDIWKDKLLVLLTNLS